MSTEDAHKDQDEDLDTASPCFPTVQSQKRVFILPRLGVGGGVGGGAVRCGGQNLV